MAARYAYECQQCHSTVELSATQAGQELKCHSCSAEFVAPKLGVIKSLPLIGGETASGKKPGRTSKSGSPLKSWLFAGGLLLAFIAGIAGAAAQYRANQFKVEVNIEDIVKSEHKAIDEMPATEIYNLLTMATEDDFRLDYTEVGYRTLNIKNGIIQKVAWVCFGIAGFGLLLLLGSFLVKS